LLSSAFPDVLDQSARKASILMARKILFSNLHRILRRSARTRRYRLVQLNRLCILAQLAVQHFYANEKAIAKYT
jgi:hypothetical protein